MPHSEPTATATPEEVLGPPAIPTRAPHESQPLLAQRSATARVAGLAGLAAFDLIVLATFVAPPLWNAPGTRSSAGAVALYAQHNATRIVVSLFIYSMAMGLFLFLAVGVWSRLRQYEPPPHVLSTTGLMAGVALTVLILAAFMPTCVLAYRHEPSAIAGLLGDMTFGLLAISGIPTAVFLASYATVVLRYGGMPRWTAYLASASAAAHVLIAASFLSHGPFLSLESGVVVWVPATFFAWILAVSATLFRGEPRRAASLLVST